MNEYLIRLENFLDLYLGKKAPAIPVDIKEKIVKYGPYFLLIPISIELSFVFPIFSMISFFGSRFGFGFSFINIFFLAIAAFQILAFVWLRKSLLKGWKLLYYVSLINVFSNPVGTLITLYILFQVKSYYKN